jgi:hypothetical protein
MIDPRSAKIEEFESAIDLINKVFRISRGHNPTMQYEFPMLLNQDNIENMIIISKDGKVVSDVNYLIQDVTIEGNDIKVASIGAVCTDPKHEGNRYSSRILDFVEEKMFNDGVDIVTISGTRTLYTRRNCSLVENCYEYIIYPKDIDIKFEIKEYDEVYLDEMMSIYNQNSTRFLRSKTQFKSLLESATIPWGNYTYKKLIILSENEIIGYLVLRIVIGEIKTGEVVEMYTKYDYDYEVLQYLGNEYNLDFIKQYVHIKDHKNQLSKYDTKELTNLAGSIKIINYEKLCKSLNRYFKQYLDEDIVDNMEFSFIDGKYIMKYNDEELIINDIDKLNKLFLQGSEVLKEELKNLKNIKEFTSKVFPINFVWTSNLNYQ